MIFAIIAITFAGYIIGRIGDYYAGHWNCFHHWIPGVILIALGVLYYKHFTCFGIGLVVSDFEDLLHFRILGSDTKQSKRFWGFD